MEFDSSPYTNLTSLSDSIWWYMLLICSFGVMLVRASAVIPRFDNPSTCATVEAAQAVLLLAMYRLENMCMPLAISDIHTISAGYVHSSCSHPMQHGTQSMPLPPRCFTPIDRTRP